MPQVDDDNPLNPYAPPTTASVVATREPGRLATRNRRLIGYLIDFVLTFAAMAILHGVYSRLTGAPETTTQSLACYLAASSFQWALITWRGQTLGKLFARTRIALPDGSDPGFVRGVVVRAWPIFFVQMLPSLMALPLLRGMMSLILLADVLPIFRADRRCAHDHIAGTFVVDARR